MDKLKKIQSCRKHTSIFTVVSGFFKNKCIKKFFITGGAGYVGAVLTSYLLEKGYKVTVLDLMIYGDEVLSNRKNLRVIKGDIRDVTLLKKEMIDHDARTFSMYLKRS